MKIDDIIRHSFTGELESIRDREPSAAEFHRALRQGPDKKEKTRRFYIPESGLILAFSLISCCALMLFGHIGSGSLRPLAAEISQSAPLDLGEKITSFLLLIRR
ncbi:hypothetical protein LJC14_00865 [Treponema sp. OttesenSCG-928-L16]|nr:hypothetical protein [Treponema sp. OttesenSCG-928-L16]